MSQQSEDGTWLSPSMQRVLVMMHERGLTIVGFRSRKGRLRYVLSDNQLVNAVTFRALNQHGLLEQVETTEEANAKGEVHYRLRTLK